MREPSWSLVPTAKCGLSSVGPCHHSSLSGPPPPRLVGLYSDFVCALATPEYSSIAAASGPVSPTAIILCMKSRRESLPLLTSPIRPRSACSSIDPSECRRRPKQNRLAPKGQRRRSRDLSAIDQERSTRLAPQTPAERLACAEFSPPSS